MGYFQILLYWFHLWHSNIYIRYGLYYIQRLGPNPDSIWAKPNKLTSLRLGKAHHFPSHDLWCHQLNGHNIQEWVRWLEILVKFNSFHPNWLMGLAINLQDVEMDQKEKWWANFLYLVLFWLEGLFLFVLHASLLGCFHVRAFKESFKGRLKER